MEQSDDVETCDSVPNFLKKRIDVKAATLTTFYDALKATNPENGEAFLDPKTTILIITNFGLVNGEIENLQDTQDQEDIVTKVDQAIFKGRDHILAAVEKRVGCDASIVNNSSIIALKNATITPFAAPQARHTFSRFFLFTDQIVGISYGTPSFTTV